MFIPIPAIDLIEGKCVRLTKGDYTKSKIYNFDPVEFAREVEGEGLPRLHVVDLDGAKTGVVVNYRVLEKITNETSLVVDFGGGVKSDDSLRIAMECGAAQIVIGSLAVKESALFEHWIGEHGAHRFILGADARQGLVAVSGWKELTEITLNDLIDEYHNKGIYYVICTDIERDGMLQGSSLDLYKSLRERFPEVKLIASGGVSALSELDSLADIGAYGAVIGKALYEGYFTLKSLGDWHQKIRVS
jgi:phosphoribosylformimino-5-aminoimidazole carboxamide ribotide isomerase